MGLFDYIVCEMPFPADAEHPEWMDQFQTKDTPAQYLESYRITEDGRLLNHDGEPSSFSGLINFYFSNWQASSGKHLFIAAGTGDVFRSREYEVLVDRGRVLRGPDLVHREDRPVDGVEVFHWSEERWMEMLKDTTSNRKEPT